MWKDQKMYSKTRIHCYGDSVTEGMNMLGHHTAAYGMDSYPAQLYTILTDAGYNVEVKNYGHGGERIEEVAVRCGGVACYTTEDILVPRDRGCVSLGKRCVDDAQRVSGTKLKIFSGKTQSEDLHIFFTQMSHDTNPVIINGRRYEMQVLGENENVISQQEPNLMPDLIPKGSLLITANEKNADVNIFYAGINNWQNLTLQSYIALMQKCAAANGGRYLILGATHAIWEQWPDLEGSSTQRYDTYRRACYRAFGIHFVDLYEEFSRHGLDIALQSGCFADKNTEEQRAMREKMKDHRIPAEFSYDGKSENNVHLSKEGYCVIARLVYQRLLQLSYLCRE